MALDASGNVVVTGGSSGIGLELARRGYKTVVMSVDPAHSLSDAFDLEKDLMDHEAGRLVNVEKNLWIQELDIQQEVETYWGEIHRYLSALFSSTGLDEILAEELAILPGMEELSALLYVNDWHKEKRYDVIVLDCAPTGESLRRRRSPRRRRRR